MKREDDLRDRSYVPFALLLVVFLGAFAARLYFGTGSGGTLQGAAITSPELSPEPEPAAVAPTLAASAHHVEARAHRPHSPVRKHTGDLLGLDALAAKNPTLFAARSDGDLESALSGIASFEEPEAASPAPRTLPAPRTEPALAASPFISQLTHSASRASLDGLEKSEVAGEKIRFGRALAPELDMVAVRAVIEAHLAEARGCYERAVELEPGLFGVLRVEMTIDAAGAVEALRFEESTIEDDELARCLSARIKSWTFPKPNAARAAITYPLVFNRS